MPSDIRRQQIVIQFEAHTTNSATHAIERLGILEIDQREPPVVLIHAGVEDPATVKRRKRGMRPAGVTLPWEIIRITLSPGATPSE